MNILAFIFRVLFVSTLVSHSFAERHYFDDVVVIEAFEDERAVFTADDVLTQRDRFSTLTVSPSLGTVKSHLWLYIERAGVKPGIANKLWLDIDNPSLDHLIVYQQTSNGQWQRLYHLGDTQLYANRPIDSRSYVIPLDLEQSEAYLIEVFGQTPLLLPMNAGEDRQILALVNGKESIIIFLFGIIFAMTIFNLVVFIATRYPEYGWYCVYMTSIGMSLVFSSGLGSAYLWRDNFWLQNHIGYVFYIFMLWGAFNFVYSYLGISKNFPRVAKLLFVLAQLPLLLLIPLFFDKHLTITLVTFFMMVLFLFGPIMGLLSSLKRVEGAFIYLVSWTIMVCGLITFNLTVQGQLPGEFFFVHSAEIGVAIESVMLSFALIYRIRKLETSTAATMQRSHDEVSAALALVNRSNTAKDVFMSKVAHQLKTPIHQLLGNVQLLSEELGEHDKYGSHVVCSDRSATELLFRIDNLLTYSQIVSDDIRPLMQKVNIRTEFKLLESKWRHLFERPKINFDIDFDPKIPMKLELDWVHLRKVFRLFLEHMLEQLPQGRVHVSLKCQQQNPPLLAIVIECPGLAFSSEEVFWFNAENNEQRWESDSLSLFMSKTLLGYMKASAQMANSVHGAQVKISCPVNEVAMANEDLDGKIEGMKVLVVDDNEINLTLMKTLLVKLGVHTTAVDSGEQAFELVKEQDFDLILMDCQMPGLSGQQTSELIRAENEQLARVPIVAVSANDSDVDRESCFYAGMNDFLAKPVRRRALEQKLKDWSHHRSSIT